MKKADLDKQVAMLLGVKKGKVAVITAAFFTHLMNAIVDDGEAQVDGFGKFRLSSKRGSRCRVQDFRKGNFKKGESIATVRVAVDKKYTVNFSKAVPFREKIRRKYGKSPVIEQEFDMEKYGVDQSVEDQEKLEKRANEGCPECGKGLIKHGQVLMCPTHGSEPFEQTKR